jgi:hypothetical protein
MCNKTASQETTSCLWLVTKESSEKKTEGCRDNTLVDRERKKFLVTNHAAQPRVLLQLVYSGFASFFLITDITLR